MLKMGKQLFPLSYQDLKEVDSREFETITCIDPLIIVNYYYFFNYGFAGSVRFFKCFSFESMG